MSLSDLHTYNSRDAVQCQMAMELTVLAIGTLSTLRDVKPSAVDGNKMCAWFTNLVIVFGKIKNTFQTL